MDSKSESELISIIVPIYKVEKYLVRCIESLLNQTYENLELILVDDGSPDLCGEICDQYAAKDERVIVIHKTNGGLSDARNVGLGIAKGNYIAFVDSDDWVSVEYIEVLYKTLNETRSDIVECGYLSTDRTIIEVKHDLVNRKIVYTSEEALKLLIEDVELKQVVWNKLYKRTILEHILFEVGKTNEDEFWTYQVYGNAKRCAKVDTKLYYYFQRPGSIMGNKFTLSRLDGIKAKVNRQKYVDTNYPTLSNIAASNLLGSIIFMGQMALLHLGKEQANQALTILEKYKNDVFMLGEYKKVGGVKEKIWLTLSLIDLKLTCVIKNKLGINIK